MTRRPPPGAAGGAYELLLLQELPGVGPVTVRRLVERFATARAALVAPAGAFAAVAGTAASAARSDRSLRARVAGALGTAERLGIAVRCWTDDDYPASLRRLADPPPVIFLDGRTELIADGPRVTVVGARRATQRGRDVAERLGAALSRRGVTVVSGLALGIDGAAHRGAVTGPGGTVAVLGSGPDVAYPATNRRLFERVKRDGLIVSEFLPGTRPAPHHFPRRNRLLAAFAPTVVVVEAGRRSGSLITVDHALDLGRDVWAVPGPIDAPTCVGSNRLLTEGARPLVSIEDFVGEVSGGRGGDPTGSTPADGPAPATDSVADSLESRILTALAAAPVPADELARRLAVSASTILATLTVLELHGEVERLPGMRFRRAA